MRCFAVIDTETNWENRVMSIGTVIADVDTFRLVNARYYIITPEYLVGGMYSDMLLPDERLTPVFCTRREALIDLQSWLEEFDVTAMYAYNAAFDYNHLPELRGLCWHDIIRMAAYRQHNIKIPHTADVCATGRLKRNYGVQPMLRLLSGNDTYHETHNALYDAMDELEIMQLLGHHPEKYVSLQQA